MVRRGVMRRRRRGRGTLLVAGLALSAVASSWAAFDALRVSPDVSTVLGGVTTRDDDVGEDDLAGAVTLVGPAGLPVGADVAAYHHLTNGDQLFALDVGATLAGPLV